MILRPYQHEADAAVFAEFTKGEPSTLVVMPTGTGKTVLFAAIIKRFLDLHPGKRALVVAHREELIRQAAQKIHAVTGLHADIEMAAERADINMFHTARVVIASKDTLRGKRLKRFKADDFVLIITDEAHHAIADTYLNVYSHFPNTFHLGVTATPDRTDEEKLGQVYKTLAFDYQLHDAIRDGWLCPIRQRSVLINGLDYSKVRTTAGDLNGRDLAEVMSNEAILQQQADATLGEAQGRKTLVFATPGFKKEGGDSFRVSERLTEIFNRHRGGIARLVTGETPKDERAQILRDFKDGLFQILVNVGVFTEGFDDPSIELVVMARATKSRPLYAQIVGRGTRPLPGIVDQHDTAEARRFAIATSAKKYCEVLDFEGNAGTHKLIHVTDILGDEYTPAEIELAERIVKKGGAAVDVATALTQARDQIIETKHKEDVAKFERAWLVAKAKWETRDIDPFDTSDVDRVHRPLSNRAEGPSDKQLKLMRKIGLKPFPDMTKRQASGMIGERLAELDAKRKGLPVPASSAPKAKFTANEAMRRAGWMVDEESAA